LLLCDVEFLKALQEILVLQRRFLVHLLFLYGKVNLHDLARVIENYSGAIEVALDIEIEHQVVTLQGLEVE
jgi:hypothetical protein